MNYYVIPVVIALFIKLTVLIVAQRSGIRTPFLYAFVGTFAAHNVCELLLFINANQGAEVTYMILRLYYAVTFILVGYSCSCALQIASVDKQDVTKFIEKYVWLGAVSGAILSLVTKEIIVGSTPISYSATALRGDNYWIFQVTPIIALLTGAFALVREIRYSESQKQRIRCSRMLIAYTPILIGTLIVTILMIYGFEVNGTMVLPITSTFFLAFLVYSERQHRLTDLRRIVPGTHENQVIETLHETFASYVAGECSYQDATDLIESLLLSYSYEKYDGNVLRTAKFMQIGRSTLYKKMEKHRIGPKHNREYSS